MKAYLANGLFSEADRMYNDYLAKLLRAEFKDLDLFVPQESGEINDKNAYADSLMIADWDTNKLLESDFLIAVLDGIEIDSGVSAEIGIFSTTGKPVIGLYTDVRQFGRDNKNKIEALIKDGTENQFMYRNLFTIGKVKENGVVVSDTNSLVNKVKQIMDKEKFE
ncbi:nucleoside 2-deoxyribosyltransferase [Bacillus phage vB_BcoS-136]|uniref:Nucleoside 2-deoxyribosyltransferase n=1 Tax=Bacillus phage vB_BcoS-136 TaxID=2419619 RepID=A0A3G3BW75_9CAUD|nr:nucleoside 2-deoxyribosyltransferase [Bacillus phage vB_BcoS-136]AYP68321.1 nucleoside 2-deoxyribosyltransferase [Bacillus phage vB_BcoS-136]